MPTGKVLEYDPQRGCGNIIDSDTKQQLEVYANYVRLGQGTTLQKGQNVEFEIETNRNRNWAVNVRILPAV